MEATRMAYVMATLRHDLERDEARRLEAYKDSRGLWTIGVGHLCGKAEPFLSPNGDLVTDSPRIHRVSNDECDALLSSDIAIAEKRANLTVPFWPTLDDVRARCILNMSFNMGLSLGAFVKFITALQRADWTQAGMELGNSLWATQVGHRAERIRKAIETGQDA